MVDMYLSHSRQFVKVTPAEQVCRQVVEKFSTTAHYNTTWYRNLYDLASRMLAGTHVKIPLAIAASGGRCIWRNGAFTMSVPDIRRWAAQGASILVRDAESPLHFVVSRPHRRWPLDRLAHGRCFDKQLDGSDVDEAAARATWQGTEVDSMWNKYSPDRALGEWLYQCSRNVGGLVLNVNRSTFTFSSARQERMEVWIL